MYGSSGFAELELLLHTVSKLFCLPCLLCAPGMMCIVKPDGLPQLCRTDEIGEICVSSRTGGMTYFGLAGVTKNTFEVRVVLVRLDVTGEACLLIDGTTLSGLVAGMESSGAWNLRPASPPHELATVSAAQPR